MKKFLYNRLGIIVFVAVLLSLTNCGKDDPIDDTPILKVSQETISVSKEGGTSTLVVETNSGWSVTIPAEASWIAAIPLSSTKKNDAITFTILPNAGQAREANVTISTSTLSKTIKVQQDGIVKNFITVAQLRAKGETTISEDLYLKASLISDQAGGNSTSQKNLFVSDSVAGICVRLVADASAMAVGTELEFKLQGAVLSKYNGLLQLNNFANADMTATGKTVVIPAKTITVAQLKSGVYESMYVAINNVQVVNADLSKTMVVGTSHTSINMETSTNENFVMFNASYSEFKALPVPQGSGTLKGIASINNSIFQVIPQNRNDFAGLTGTRFGSAPQLTYGTPALSGSYKKGVALSAENVITLPYNLATTGQAYSLSVAVSGEGAAGFTTPVVANGSFASASGNIVIPLAGTPSTSGNITLTITGTGITTPIVLTGAVTDPAITKTMATWTFDVAPAGFPIASSTISTDESTNGSLTLSGFTAPLPTIGYTSSSKTIYVNTWEQGKSWLFSFTPKATIASGRTLSLTYKGYGSSTAPKDMVVEYSKDGANWVQMGAAIEYTATNASYTRAIDLTESLSGPVQIRIKVNTAVSISGSTIAAGGNSRLGDVVISVN
jgi:hypothetical protein